MLLIIYEKDFFMLVFDVCYFCKKTLKYPEFSWYLITKFVK